MKRSIVLSVLCLALLVVQLLLGGCAPAATPAPTPVPPTVVPPTATPVPPKATPVPPKATPVPPTTTLVPEPVLEIVGPSGSKSLTMDDLKKLEVIEGEAGFKSSTGKITPPVPHRGVSLLTLAELLGPLDPEMGLNAVAKDGYAMTFSYDQLKNGTFTAYDPATGDELKTPENLTAMLAFEREGQPLPEDTDGALRVVIISPKRDQVTDGHWSVKWINKLEVKPLVADWTVDLKGGIEAKIDRSTFESCVGCHKATWTDDKAQVWTGVPLWLLMGYADDEVKHQGPAFNEALAKAGYKVDVVAKDGFIASLDSAPLARQNEVLVASLVNDNPLPEGYFPLRLVGSSLKKKEMVGAISKIVLEFNGAAATTVEPTEAPKATEAPKPTAAPTAVAAPPAAVMGDLVITGAVEKPLGLKEADLRGMDVVKITAEHPKKGLTAYEGVRLSLLLALARPTASATKIVLVAGDGFSAEADLAAIQGCADCMVAFTNTPGELNLAMPTLPSSLWVKDISEIQLK
jgi:DMSO/TMAO reductase YedYZ molybdopterin-dependent catalytic subunit